jgi:hypothetical protein
MMGGGTFLGLLDISGCGLAPAGEGLGSRGGGGAAASPLGAWLSAQRVTLIKAENPVQEVGGPMEETRS